MQIIDWIQPDNPIFILDWTFRIITEFGDAIFFIVFGAFMYWVVDKKFGFKMMIAFMFSALLNGAIKHFTNKPRPYMEGARPILQETTGSSMPSGHSQGIGALGSMMMFQYKKKWIWWIFGILMVLVPFSRMYLGQHYLEDVLVGLVLGIIMGLLGLSLLSVGNPDQEDIRALVLVPVFIALMIFIKNDQLYVAGGGYIGLSFGYFIEKRYIKYDNKELWYIHILKMVIGLGVAFGLKEGLKPLFKLIHQDNVSLNYLFDAIRYFMVALWASLGAMAVFKVLFRKEGRQRFTKPLKQEENA